MRQTFEKIAGQLNAANKTVPLICVFNEISETCLSRALQNLIAPQNCGGCGRQTLVCKNRDDNAFTEGLQATG